MSGHFAIKWILVAVFVTDTVIKLYRVTAGPPDESSSYASDNAIAAVMNTLLLAGILAWL